MNLPNDFFDNLYYINSISSFNDYIYYYNGIDLFDVFDGEITLIQSNFPPYALNKKISPMEINQKYYTWIKEEFYRSVWEDIDV